MTSRKTCAAREPALVAVASLASPQTPRVSVQAPGQLEGVLLEQGQIADLRALERRASPRHLAQSTFTSPAIYNEYLPGDVSLNVIDEHRLGVSVWRSVRGVRPPRERSAAGGAEPPPAAGRPRASPALEPARPESRELETPRSSRRKRCSCRWVARRSATLAVSCCSPRLLARAPYMYVSGVRAPS